LPSDAEVGLSRAHFNVQSRVLKKAQLSKRRVTRRGAIDFASHSAFSRERTTMPKDQKVTLDEVVEVIGGEVRKAGDKYFDFLQKTVSSYPLGDTELGGQGKELRREKHNFGS
jgi:hypothetical protein